MEREETTAVVPTDEVLPAVPEEDTQYLDDEELTTPRIRINQQAKGDIPAGVFVNNLTEEQFGEFECVLLDMRKGRVLWDDDLDNDDPLCKSNDFKTGEGDPGGDCFNCPKAEWPASGKPECSETYTFLGMDDAGLPFFFTVARTGIPPARRYLSGFQLKKKPLYYCLTKISLREEKKGGNAYFVPVFKKGETLPADEIPEMQDAKKALDAVWERFQAKREETNADYDSGLDDAVDDA